MIFIIYIICNIGHSCRIIMKSIAVKISFFILLLSLSPFSSRAEAEPAFRSVITMANGGVYYFQLENDSNHLGKIRYRKPGRKKFKIITEGRMDFLPVPHDVMRMNQSVDVNSLTTPLMPVPDQPRELWVRINSEWHILFHGHVIQINHDFVPDQIKGDPTSSQPYHFNGRRYLADIWKNLEKTILLPVVFALGSTIYPKYPKAFAAAYIVGLLTYSAKDQIWPILTHWYQTIQFAYNAPFVFNKVGYFIFSSHSKDAHLNVTAIIRLSDNKAVILDRLARPPEALKFELSKQGVLQINGLTRGVSLEHFDVEATFVPQAVQESKEWWEPAETKLERIRGSFRNTRELANRINFASTEKTETAIEKLKTIFYSGKDRKAAAILGPSGSGKTTVALSFLNQLPPTWFTFKVDRSAFKTRFVGELEKQVEEMVQLSKQIPVVWFIDEMHSLSGVGTYDRNPNDFYEMVKGPLSAGEVMLLGTDTSEEFYEAFSKNPALITRFHTIKYGDAITPEETSQNILNWVNANQFPPPDASTLERIIFLASLLNPVDAEPKRSVAPSRKTLLTLDTKSWTRRRSQFSNYHRRSFGRTRTLPRRSVSHRSPGR